MPAPNNVYQKLIQELTGIVPSAALAPLLQFITPVHLPPGALYIKEGDTHKKIAFIEKGLLRTYFIKDNGDEATLFLRWEGHTIASHDTIIYHRPSRFRYRALEPTTVFEIDYAKLEELLKIYPGLEAVRSHFLLKMLADTLRLVETFVLLTPEGRYQELINTRGTIVRRVPDKYIASILGVTPVSLSRIKKRMYNKGKRNPS
ncbi:MAG: Crp/Fnr family transcriptional regulator [Niabella sp.]|nr:Crp/Fnr family transcriptional regulator [Niabella sp.]